jgi:hypothetical protein
MEIVMVFHVLFAMAIFAIVFSLTLSAATTLELCFLLTVCLLLNRIRELIELHIRHK